MKRLRYIHKWYTPIIVVVYGVAEHWYYAPSYDHRKVPVVIGKVK